MCCIYKAIHRYVLNQIWNKFPPEPLRINFYFEEINVFRVTAFKVQSSGLKCLIHIFFHNIWALITS